MPLYDWTCEKCGHKFEALAKYTTLSGPCTKCNGRAKREFPGPLILTSDRRAANTTFDPVEGKEMSKYEQEYWKNQPWPSTSDHAKKRNVVGKKSDDV